MPVRGVWLVLALLVSLEAGLRNTMPTPQLERFKAEANRQAHAFPGTYIQEAAPQNNRLFLTFDDGPDARTTPQILDLLKTHNIKATFFFLGENMARFPQIVKRAAAEGHLVLSHGYTHVDFRKLSFARVMEEQVRPSQALIREFTGKEQRALRPPYGAVTDAQIREFAKAGFTIVNWSVDSFDWMRGQTPGTIIVEVTANLHDGAIILMHSGSGNTATVAALKTLVPTLLERGVCFEKIDAIGHL